MLSIETQYKLREFLQTLGDFELSIELLRQRLASLYEFEPFSCFQRLDRTGCKAITAEDICIFLEQNQRGQYSVRDCQFIMKYFDIDEDQALNYTEFMQMILPCDDLVLRSEASQRQTGRFDLIQGRLSPSIERALTEFLEREINLHLKLDSMKQQLLARFDWNTELAFQQCDTTQEGFLSHKNLQIFLRQSGHFASDEEIIAIVRRLDADADQRINYIEFCEAFKPMFGFVPTVKNEFPLSSMMPERGPRSYAYDTAQVYTTNRVERSYSPSLKKRSQFDRSSTRKSVTFEDVNFERTQAVIDRARTTNQMIRRMTSEVPMPLQVPMPDQVGIGVVHASPLRGSPQRFMSPTPLINKFEIHASPVRGGLSFLKQSIDQSKYPKLYNPQSHIVNMNKINVTRALIQGSAKKADRMQYADADDHQFNSTQRFVARQSMPWPVNSFDLSSMPIVKEGPLPRVSPLNNEEEDELITVFKDIISQERELEEAKIRLTQCGDFNLQDGFQLIDVERKGWVTAPQVQAILQQFGKFQDKDEIYAFFRRYDNDSDGRLLYSDFCDAFTPQDPFHANELSQRQGQYIHSGHPTFTYFNPDTRDLLFNCFRVHFQIEEQIEALKSRLTRRPKFNLRDCFQYLDCFDKSFLTRDSFKRILQENKFYPTDAELTWITNRFDYNHNGRISYQEFMEEIMPKKSKF